MRTLLALLFFVPSLCLAQSVTLPYNPDVNADSAIGAPDLLEMLPLFGGYFTPDPILIDGMEINEYLNMLEENGSSPLIEGSEYGQMLFWNGEEWTLVPVGAHGEVLTIEGTTPTWQAPSEDDTPEVGCADQTACNYDSGASVNWAPLCVYEDECGICDGPGAIYECGCADLPEGDCDCNGNQLDALNVCGGTCAADVDGDGICDDGDDCIGEADECGVCNGPGAIYECGCSEPDPEACDCAGNTLDAVGVCGGGCTEDADGDGIGDTEDDCVGEYDFCGVCNGPGPFLGCGCEDIPDGYCDCNGNVLDAVGTCGGACQNDINGDGICDDDSIPGCTYEVACNYDPSASIDNGSCNYTSCYGCTDPSACNYSATATNDNNSCWYADPSYDCEFNCLSDTDGDGVCDDLEIIGCTDPEGCDFDPAATEDGLCEYCTCADSIAIGCTDQEACNYDLEANCSDESCLYPGCTISTAINFDNTAGCDDGSCLFPGCIQPVACNFNPDANIDDGSCEFGYCAVCTDPFAVNYNPTSSIPDDSLCIYLDLLLIYKDWNINDLMTTEAISLNGTVTEMTFGDVLANPDIDFDQYSHIYIDSGTEGSNNGLAPWSQTTEFFSLKNSALEAFIANGGHLGINAFWYNINFYGVESINPYGIGETYCSTSAIPVSNHPINSGVGLILGSSTHNNHAESYPNDAIPILGDPGCSDPLEGVCCLEINRTTEGSLLFSSISHWCCMYDGSAPFIANYISYFLGPHY